MRPPGVVTYRFEDSDDLCSKLTHVVENYAAVKGALEPHGIQDNIQRVVKWMIVQSERDRESVHACAAQN
jgi:hypothetical protein